MSAITQVYGNHQNEIFYKAILLAGAELRLHVLKATNITAREPSRLELITHLAVYTLLPMFIS